MRNPFPRPRKTTPTATSANIDATPSTSRTLGSRFLGRPSSHKSTGAHVSSDSSVSRASGLSLSRFHGRAGAQVAQSTTSHGPDSLSRASSGGDTTSHSSNNNNFTYTSCSLSNNNSSSSSSTTTLPILSSGSATTGSSITVSAGVSTSITLPSRGPPLPLAPPSSSTSSSEKGSKTRPRGLVGLQNLGNTCFMNSCLQCVSNVPAVVHYFQSGAYLKEINETSPTKGALAIAFGDLIKALWSSPEFTATRPVELKRVIGKVASRFTGYDQQDAQEFLRFLVDGLHEDLNRIKKKPPYYEIKDRDNTPDRDVSDEYWRFYLDRNHSALSELFCGQLRSEIRCHTCNHRSLCFDVFWDLSVPVPKKPKVSAHLRIASVFSSSSSASSSSSSSAASGGSAEPSSPSGQGVSIQDCLKAYTEQELLDDGDSYYCSKCKTHRAVTKKISLYRLPQVLVVHLKRFSYSTFSRDKVTTAIRFPAVGLNVAEFCAEDAVLDGSTLYDLTGVVNHVGSLHGGHYTAECVNADTNDWYDFNDASVSLVKKPQLCSASAYILFFRRRDEKSLTI
ncbi:hypothetical protein PINS_up010659 [Pythium insidiosum]|nr:hypothetical protein PINS_up010659 [Pythium insidiosum]